MPPAGFSGKMCAAPEPPVCRSLEPARRISTSMRNHDVGGTHQDEAIPREQHAFMPWELRTDALLWILSDGSRAGGPQMTVDELRRGIEDMPAEDYRNLGYFSKWLRSMIAITTERGLISSSELERRAAAIAEEEAREHAREHHSE